MPDDDAEGGESESPGDWRAFEERYNAEPEPDEFDPQELGPDIPEAPDMTEVEASSEVQYRFWTLVMVFNIALLVTSLGVMFVAFQGALELGGQLTLAGLLLFAFGYYRYRQTRAALAERDEDDTSSASEDEDGEDNEDNEDDAGAQNDVDNVDEEAAEDDVTDKTGTDDRSDENGGKTVSSGGEDDENPDRNG